MMHVARLSLLKTWKEKSFLVVMIGVALLFAGVFGMVFGTTGNGGPSKIPVGVADLDGTPLTKAIVTELASAGAYSVSDMSEDDIRAGIREGSLEVGYVFPDGFEESATGPNPLSVQVISLSTSKLAMTVGAAIDKTVSQYALLSAVSAITEETAGSLGLKVDAEAVALGALRDLRERPAVFASYKRAIRQPVKEGSDVMGRSHFSIGLFLMFTMFTVIFQAGDILQERHDGTWGRLLTTPVSRGSILGGKILGAYVVGAIQVAVLFLSGRFLFGIDYGPRPWLVAAILGVFLLCVTGLGILMSTVVRTTAQLQALSPIVITATCMLGGCYWPLEVVPKTMRVIGKFTPQAWAMLALDDVVARGAGVSAMYLPLTVLVGFSLVFFLLGVARIKFE